MGSADIKVLDENPDIKGDDPAKRDLDRRFK